jgi:hypothetical protein
MGREQKRSLKKDSWLLAPCMSAISAAALSVL